MQHGEIAVAVYAESFEIDRRTPSEKAAIRLANGIASKSRSVSGNKRGSVLIERDNVVKVMPIKRVSESDV
jgi:hypothetical protein